MQRRSLLGICLAVVLLGQPAFAKDFTERVMDQLRDQGFASIVVERTLLGRTRILADSRDGRREIILNPRTGEILRDLWIATSGQTAGGALIRDDDGGGRGRGRGGDSDGDDDDDNSGKGGGSDDDDTDNSGKGGGSDDGDSSGKDGGSDDDD